MNERGSLGSAFSEVEPAGWAATGVVAAGAGCVPPGSWAGNSLAESTISKVKMSNAEANKRLMKQISDCSSEHRASSDCRWGEGEIEADALT